MKKREKTKICNGKSEICRAYLLCSKPQIKFSQESPCQPGVKA